MESQIGKTISPFSDCALQANRHLEVNPSACHNDFNDFVHFIVSLLSEGEFSLICYIND